VGRGAGGGGGGGGGGAGGGGGVRAARVCDGRGVCGDTARAGGRRGRRGTGLKRGGIETSEKAKVDDLGPLFSSASGRSMIYFRRYGPGPRKYAPFSSVTRPTKITSVFSWAGRQKFPAHENLGVSYSVLAIPVLDLV
jgi:hypothetical protein